MSTDIRAALERLVELEDAKGPAPAIANAWTDAIAAARAALAEPVGEGPSDEELLELAENAWIPFSKSQPHPQGHSWDLVLARTVLARWGTPAAPPAPVVGEVEG